MANTLKKCGKCGRRSQTVFSTVLAHDNGLPLQVCKSCANVLPIDIFVSSSFISTITIDTNSVQSNLPILLQKAMQYDDTKKFLYSNMNSLDITCPISVQEHTENINFLHGLVHAHEEKARILQAEKEKAMLAKMHARQEAKRQGKKVVKPFYKMTLGEISKEIKVLQNKFRNYTVYLDKHGMPVQTAYALTVEENQRLHALQVAHGEALKKHAKQVKKLHNGSIPKVEQREIAKDYSHLTEEQKEAFISRACQAQKEIMQVKQAVTMYDQKGEVFQWDNAVKFYRLQGVSRRVAKKYASQDQKSFDIALKRKDNREKKYKEYMAGQKVPQVLGNVPRNSSNTSKSGALGTLDITACELYSVLPPKTKKDVVTRRKIKR